MHALITQPRLIVVLTLTASLHFCPITFAQPEPSQRPQPPASNRPQRMQPVDVPAARFGPGFEQLLRVLTDEQRASLRQTYSEHREKSRELEEKARTARRELMAAAFAEKFTEQTVRQRALAAAELEAELTVLRIKALSEIRPPLTPEQLDEVKNSFSSSEARPERRSRRPDVPRDEHGLPPKDRTTPEPKAE